MEHKPFRGFRAILFKEFIVVWRDPLTLFLLFPAVDRDGRVRLCAADNDVKHMAMLVLNEDRTVESRLLIDQFVNTQSFRVVGEAQSLDQLKSEMRKRTAYHHLHPAELYPRTNGRPLRTSGICLLTDPIPQRHCKLFKPDWAWH